MREGRGDVTACQPFSLEEGLVTGGWLKWRVWGPWAWRVDKQWLGIQRHELQGKDGNKGIWGLGRSIVILQLVKDARKRHWWERWLKVALRSLGRWQMERVQWLAGKCRKRIKAWNEVYSCRSRHVGWQKGQTRMMFSLPAGTGNWKDIEVTKSCPCMKEVPVSPAYFTYQFSPNSSQSLSRRGCGFPAGHHLTGPAKTYFLLSGSKNRQIVTAIHCIQFIC